MPICPTSYNDSKKWYFLLNIPSCSFVWIHDSYIHQITNCTKLGSWPFILRKNMKEAWYSSMPFHIYISIRIMLSFVTKRTISYCANCHDQRSQWSKIVFHLLLKNLNACGVRFWAQTAIIIVCGGRWGSSCFIFILVEAGFGLVSCRIAFASIGLGNILFVGPLPLLAAILTGTVILEGFGVVFFSDLPPAFGEILLGLTGWSEILASHGRAAIQRSTQLHPQLPFPIS